MDKLESLEKSRAVTRYLGDRSYKERQNQWDLLSLKKTEVGHNKSDQIMGKAPTK